MAMKRKELADMDLDFGSISFDEIESEASPPVQQTKERRRAKRKEREESYTGNKALKIFKRIVITLLVLATMAGMAFGMWYLINVYTGVMIERGVKEEIANFGYNEEVIFEGDYLALTTEGDEYIIRPKAKDYKIGFKDWVNKYYTISDKASLETSEGTLQENGFEVYYINSNPEVESWVGWLHCEVYRDVIIIKDAEGECDDETLKDMASTFITLIEPKLSGAEGK